MNRAGRTRAVVGTGAALALVATVVSCGSDSADGGASGASAKKFVYGDPMEPSSLNPLLQDQTDPVTEMVFRGLVGHDAHNKVKPALARSWHVSDDGKTYTFQLRHGVHWQDGKAFSSADVAYTLDQVRDPKVNSPAASQFEAVDKVTTPDRNTVTLHLKSPFAGLMDALSLGILPKHLLAGKDITKASSFNKAPVGTGPYRLASYRKGDSATLRANKRWYGDKPHIREIVLRFVPDASQRLVQLRNGELDGAFLEPEQVDAAKKVSGTSLLREKTADYRALVYNTRLPLLKDKRVRKALDAAIDRSALVSSALHGYGQAAYGPLDRSPYANKKLKKTPHDDQARVKKLMESAGWKKQHGIWTKHGKQATFQLSTFTDDQLRADMQHLLADDFRKAGFKVSTKLFQASWVFSHWSKVQVFQTGAASPYDPDYATFDTFHCGEEGTKNYGAYCDKGVDKDLDKGRGSTDGKTRHRAYDDFQKRLRDNPPYSWLTYLDTVYAMPKGLKGPQKRLLGHHGAGLFENAQDWTLSSK